MADKIVRPKVKKQDGTYDNLIIETANKLNSKTIKITTDENGTFIWNNVLTINTLYAVFSAINGYMGMVFTNNQKESYANCLYDRYQMTGLYTISMGSGGQGVLYKTALDSDEFTYISKHELTFIPICSLNSDNDLSGSEVENF